MPGLYLNDGGQTASALGTAIGQLADNVSPEGRARAQLLYYQTQKADTDAQQAADALKTGRTAEYGLPGLTSQLGMNIPPPSGVAGTAASLAQPPDGTSAAPAPYDWHSPVDESSFTPWQTYLANEMRNGRLGADALKTDINTGQSRMPGGPGMTDTAIQTRSTMPLSPGQTINVTGRPDGSGGAAGGSGGTTMSGGSTYTQTGENAGATSDEGLASRDLEDGAAAKVTLGRADLMDQLYTRLDQLGTNSPSEITKDLAVEALSRHLGLDLSRYSDVASMKNEIRTLGLGLTGTLKTTQGNPMPKGSLDAIQAMAADPNTPPEQFHRMVEVIKNVAQGQADNYDAALKFRQNRPKLGDQAGIDYHVARGQNAANQGKALEGLAPPTTSAYPPIPRSAITRLQGNPALRGDFDKMFGPGAAARVLGE